MTVTYTHKVATANIGFFLRLLFRWKGSIYKLIWKDFLMFLLLYYALRFIYRDVLNEAQKRIFEEIAAYTKSYQTLIPFSFVLGFFMQVVFQRWQNMFSYITWPDKMALVVTANIKGLDDRGRLLRRTIMRYLIVGYIMNQRSVCPSVKRRFPTLNHLTQAGILMPDEEQIIEDIPQNQVNKYVIPFLWAVNVIALARKEGRIYNDYAVSILNAELLDYRLGLGRILRYDTTSIPLVYTQSVTFAVHMFVVLSLFATQFLEVRQDGGEGDIDQYIHLGGLLQFFIYMGWLKLAEMMINPFGDDDDDFDMNILIDRNLQYCYLVVDDLHSDVPPLVKDIYWNQKQFHLPYTQALAHKPQEVNTELGSADAVKVPESKSAFVHEGPGGTPGRFSVTVMASELPPTPEEPKESPGLSTSGKLKNSMSGTLTYPKKFLETVEQQFQNQQSNVEVSNPFDNRFEEVEYSRATDHHHSNAPHHKGAAIVKAQKDRLANHGNSFLSKLSSSRPVSGARRIADGIFHRDPIPERSNSTVGVISTARYQNSDAQRRFHSDKQPHGPSPHDPPPPQQPP